MKRNIGIYLLAVLALAALSCSEDGGKPAETTADAGTAAVQSTGTETEEIDYNSLSFLERLKYSNAQIADNLPELSLGGETFKIWLRSEAANPTMSSEETGEVLDDASYAQKRSVEERFDVVIEYDHYAGEWTSSMKRFYSNIMSGDYFADIVENWNATTASSISQGYYMDISGYDVIDIEKPWYFRDEIESGTYRGSFYSVIGFMNPKVVFGDMTCTIFNKDLAATYDLDNLYQVVRDGDWTMDYVMEICRDFYSDTNGDNKVDIGDLFGFVNDPLNGWYHGFAQLGVPLMDIAEDGSYTLSVYDNADAVQPVLDKLKELNDLDANIYNVRNHGMIYDDMHQLGNTLFCFGALKLLDYMKDVDFNYGILPRFKADENQEYYYTTALNNPWSVPVTAKSGETSAVIMTAFAAEGYRQVVPVCYEKTIKTKNVTDEESGEMIDLMLQNVRGETMFYFTDMDVFAHHTVIGEYAESNKGFGSFFEAKRKKIEKSVTSILDAYEALQQ